MMVEVQQTASVESVCPPADEETDAWPNPREYWACDEESGGCSGGE